MCKGKSTKNRIFFASQIRRAVAFISRGSRNRDRQNRYKTIPIKRAKISNPRKTPALA